MEGETINHSCKCYPNLVRFAIKTEKAKSIFNDILFARESSFSNQQPLRDILGVLVQMLKLSEPRKRTFQIFAHVSCPRMMENWTIKYDCASILCYMHEAIILLLPNT